MNEQLVAELRSWVEEFVKPGSLDELLLKAADLIEQLLADLAQANAQFRELLLTNGSMGERNMEYRLELEHLRDYLLVLSNIEEKTFIGRDDLAAAVRKVARKGCEVGARITPNPTRMVVPANHPLATEPDVIVNVPLEGDCPCCHGSRYTFVERFKELRRVTCPACLYTYERPNPHGGPTDNTP